MNGKFVKKISPFMAVLFILGAAALVLVPVKLNQWTDVTPCLYTMLMVLWGLGLAAFLLFFGLFLLVNRGAYLRLSEDGIAAKYGLGAKLECSLQSLNYIAVGPAMLTLESGGKLHDIGGLANVGEIATWLKQQLPFVVPEESRELLLTQREQIRISRKKWLIATLVSTAMLFVNILLIALATGRRDMRDFTNRDVVFFGIFIVMELLTVIAAFYCANRGGKYMRLLAVNHDKLRCKLIATVPLPLGDAIGVFYDGSGQRLTLYADPEDQIYYITQNMAPGYVLKISGECEPTANTEAIDRKIEEMRDISFLFGME